MSKEKKKCCQGCKKGQPGQNKSCQVRLMVEQMNAHKALEIIAKTEV